MEFFREEKNDSALFYFHQVLANYRNKNDSLLIIKTCTSLADIYIRLDKYDSAKVLLEKAKKFVSKKNANSYAFGDFLLSYANYQIFTLNYKDAGKYLDDYFTYRNKFPEFDKELAIAHYNAGYVYRRSGNYKKAMQHFRKALTVTMTADSANQQLLGTIMTTIGGMMRFMGNPSDAEVQLLEAEKVLYSSSRETRNFRLALLYASVGNIKYDAGDYYLALKYYKKAERVFNSSGYDNYNNIALNLNNQAKCHMNTGNYQKAIEILNKVFDLPGISNDVKVNTYKNLAKLHAITDNKKKAGFYYREGINQAEKTNKSNFIAASIFYGYATFLKNEKKYPEALEQFKQALYRYQSLLEPNNLNIIDIKADIGETQVLNAELTLGLASINEAIHLLDQNAMMDSLPGQKVVWHKSRIHCFKKKGDALKTRFLINNEVKYLEDAFNCYITCLQSIENLRQSYLNIESKLLITEQQKNVFNQLVDMSYELYQLTGEKEYLDKAFLFSEKSKAAILLSYIRDINAKDFAGIPAELLSRETSLKKELSVYKEFLYEELQRKEPDTIKIGVWEELIFEFSRDIDSIHELYEMEYPAYHRLKNNTYVYKIYEVQHFLLENQCLLEFFQTDSVLYSFFITRDTSIVKKIFLPENFTGSTRYFTEKISNIESGSKAREQYNLFCKNAYRLYQQLVSPFKDYIAGKQITIIPDENFSSLPFDILLTSPVDSVSTINYRELPYLIKEVPINYAYSATLQFEKNYTPSHKNKLLAFAPRYSETLKNDAFLFRQTYTEELSPIPGARKEVENISKIIKSKVFTDKQASEKKFKQHCEGYDILHLAMHTIIDDENPMYSKMVFTQIDDSLEDGLLNTYEIFNLKLKAKLAVLSSCNTGSGKIMQGEGMFSLSRGFSFAGCPSLIMTLWKVEDNTSMVIMNSFYKNIQNGFSVSKALQQAKIEFLTSSDNLLSHPYFWTPYISIGNNAPLFTTKGSGFPGIINIILVFTAISLAIVLYVKIKKSKRQTFATSQNKNKDHAHPAMNKNSSEKN